MLPWKCKHPEMDLRQHRHPAVAPMVHTAFVLLFCPRENPDVAHDCGQEFPKATKARKACHLSPLAWESKILSLVAPFTKLWQGNIRNKMCVLMVRCQGEHRHSLSENSFVQNQCINIQTYILRLSGFTLNKPLWLICHLLPSSVSIPAAPRNIHCCCSSYDLIESMYCIFKESNYLEYKIILPELKAWFDILFTTVYTCLSPPDFESWPEQLQCWSLCKTHLNQPLCPHSEFTVRCKNNLRAVVTNGP